MTRTSKLLMIVLVVALGGQIAMGASLQLPGHNNPPAARPHFRAGGESFPPLPLPVTPVRRSEKKREPAPPVLVAKLAYAKNFYNITNDVRNLLTAANKAMNISYRPASFSWSNFSFDPTEVPVLYITGHDPIGKPSEDLIRRVRSYVYGGGSIIANACCGDPTFTKSFRQFVKIVFPDRPMQTLPMEHPVYFCYSKVNEVQYQKGTNEFYNAAPHLEGIDLGCRTAVIFAPYDLGNGWYGQMPPKNFPPGHWVLRDDARRLGANIITYILGNQQYARQFPHAQIQYLQAASGGQSLAIGQLIHGGDWDPNPSALQRLQKYIAENSTIPVAFKRSTVSPADAAIFSYPVLYIVGHKNFVFTDEEASNLRRYLAQGGVLLAEACCGRKEFDLAFRREIKRVLSDYQLKPISSTHSIYDVNFRIRSVELTNLARTYYPQLNGPWLETIEVSGRTAVIYSPLAIGNGWEGIPHAFAAGYSGPDALRIGVNIFVYILSH